MAVPEGVTAIPVRTPNLPNTPSGVSAIPVEGYTQERYTQAFGPGGTAWQESQRLIDMHNNANVPTGGLPTPGLGPATGRPAGAITAFGPPPKLNYEAQPVSVTYGPAPDTEDEESEIGFLSNSLRGSAERLSGLVGDLVVAAGKTAEELNPWDDDDVDNFIIDIGRKMESADFGYEERATLDATLDVFKSDAGILTKLKALSAFALETGVVSLADMAAMTNPYTAVAYIAARIEEVAQSSAEANNKENPELSEYVRGAVVAPTIALMERMQLGMMFKSEAAKKVLGKLDPAGLGQRISEASGDVTNAALKRLPKVGQKVAGGAGRVIGAGVAGAAGGALSEGAEEYGTYVGTQKKPEVGKAALGGALAEGPITATGKVVSEIANRDKAIPVDDTEYEEEETTTEVAAEPSTQDNQAESIEDIRAQLSYMEANPDRKKATFISPETFLAHQADIEAALDKAYNTEGMEVAGNEEYGYLITSDVEAASEFNELTNTRLPDDALIDSALASALGYAKPKSELDPENIVAVEKVDSETGRIVESELVENTPEAITAAQQKYSQDGYDINVRMVDEALAERSDKVEGEKAQAIPTVPTPDLTDEQRARGEGIQQEMDMAELLKDIKVDEEAEAEISKADKSKLAGATNAVAKGPLGKYKNEQGGFTIPMVDRDDMADASAAAIDALNRKGLTADVVENQDGSETITPRFPKTIEERRENIKKAEDRAEAGGVSALLSGERKSVRIPRASITKPDVISALEALYKNYESKDIVITPEGKSFRIRLKPKAKPKQSPLTAEEKAILDHLRGVKTTKGSTKSKKTSGDQKQMFDEPYQEELPFGQIGVLSLPPPARDTSLAVLVDTPSPKGPPRGSKARRAAEPQQGDLFEDMADQEDRAGLPAPPEVEEGTQSDMLEGGNQAPSGSGKPKRKAGAKVARPSVPEQGDLFSDSGEDTSQDAGAATRSSSESLPPYPQRQPAPGGPFVPIASKPAPKKPARAKLGIAKGSKAGAKGSRWKDRRKGKSKVTRTDLQAPQAVVTPDTPAVVEGEGPTLEVQLEDAKARSAVVAWLERLRENQRDKLDGEGRARAQKILEVIDSSDRKPLHEVVEGLLKLRVVRGKKSALPEAIKAGTDTFVAFINDLTKTKNRTQVPYAWDSDTDVSPEPTALGPLQADAVRIYQWIYETLASHNKGGSWSMNKDHMVDRAKDVTTALRSLVEKSELAANQKQAVWDDIEVEPVKTIPASMKRILNMAVVLNRLGTALNTETVRWGDLARQAELAGDVHKLNLTAELEARKSLADQPIPEADVTQGVSTRVDVEQAIVNDAATDLASLFGTRVRGRIFHGVGTGSLIDRIINADGEGDAFTDDFWIDLANRIRIYGKNKSRESAFFDYATALEAEAGQKQTPLRDSWIAPIAQEAKTVMESRSNDAVVETVEHFPGYRALMHARALGNNGAMNEVGETGYETFLSLFGRLQQGDSAVLPIDVKRAADSIGMGAQDFLAFVKFAMSYDHQKQGRTPAGAAFEGVAQDMLAVMTGDRIYHGASGVDLEAEQDDYQAHDARFGAGLTATKSIAEETAAKQVAAKGAINVEMASAAAAVRAEFSKREKQEKAENEKLAVDEDGNLDKEKLKTLDAISSRRRAKDLKKALTAVLAKYDNDEVVQEEIAQNTTAQLTDAERQAELDNLIETQGDEPIVEDNNPYEMSEDVTDDEAGYGSKFIRGSSSPVVATRKARKRLRKLFNRAVKAANKADNRMLDTRRASAQRLVETGDLAGVVAAAQKMFRNHTVRNNPDVGADYIGKQNPEGYKPNERYSWRINLVDAGVVTANGRDFVQTIYDALSPGHPDKLKLMDFLESGMDFDLVFADHSVFNQEKIRRMGAGAFIRTLSRVDLESGAQASNSNETIMVFNEAHLNKMGNPDFIDEVQATDAAWLTETLAHELGHVLTQTAYHDPRSLDARNRIDEMIGDLRDAIGTARPRGAIYGLEDAGEFLTEIRNNPAFAEFLRGLHPSRKYRQKYGDNPDAGRVRSLLSEIAYQVRRMLSKVFPNVEAPPSVFDEAMTMVPNFYLDDATAKQVFAEGVRAVVRGNVRGITDKYDAELDAPITAADVAAPFALGKSIQQREEAVPDKVDAKSELARLTKGFKKPTAVWDEVEKSIGEQMKDGSFDVDDWLKPGQMPEDLEVAVKRAKTNGKQFLRNLFTSEGAMGWRTNDQLVRAYNTLFKGGLKRWQDVGLAKRVIVNQERQRANNILRKSQDVRKDHKKDAYLLDELKNDATLYEIDPTVSWFSKSNQYARLNPEKRHQYNELRKKYQKLKNIDQRFADVFVDEAKYHKDQRAKTVKWSIHQLIQTEPLLETLDDAAKVRIAEAINRAPSRKRAEDILLNSKDVPMRIPEADVESLLSTIETIKQMAEVNGMYFPLRRWGNKVVHATKEWTPIRAPDKLAAIQTKDRIMAGRDPGFPAGTKATLDFSQEGEWVVRTFSETTMMFENEADAVAAEAELAEEYGSARHVRRFERENLHMESAYVGHAAPFVRRLTKNSPSDAGKRFIQQTFIEMLAENSIKKSELTRRKIAGASMDTERAFAERAMANAWAIADLQLAQKEAKVLGDLQKQANDEASSGAAIGSKQRDAATKRSETMGRVVNELHHRDEQQFKDRATNVWADRFTKFGYYYHLASPSYSVINATQVPLVAAPYFAARYGIGKSTGAMVSNFKQFLGSDTLLNELWRTGGGTLQLPDQLAQNMAEAIGGAKGTMIARLIDEGLIDATFIQELQSSLGGTDPNIVIKKGSGLLRWAHSWPQFVEQMNRIVVAGTAYDLASKNETSLDKVYEFAREAIRETQLDYTEVNKPRHFKALGSWGRVFLLFRMYTQGITALYAKNIARSLGAMDKHNLSKAKRRQLQMIALKELGGLTLAHSALVGVAGGVMSQPVRLLASMAQTLAQQAGFMEDDEHLSMDDRIELWSSGVVKEFSDFMGLNWDEDQRRKAAEALTRGLPRTFNFDLYSRIGLHELFFRMPDENLLPSEKGAAIAQAIMGPIFAPVPNVMRGLDYLGQGDYLKAAAAALPKGLRDVARAADYTVKGGVTNYRGGIDYETTAADIALTATGLQSGNQARFREKQRSEISLDKRLQAKASEIRAVFVNPNSTPEQIQQAWNDRIKFNTKHRDYRVTQSSIVRAKRELRKQEMRSSMGMYTDNRNYDHWTQQ